MENFDFNNIEKYLRNGGDASVIANAFANKLNSTINAMKVENELKDAAEDVSLAWNDYIDIYFGINKLPSGTVIADWYLKAEDVNKLLDSVIHLFPTVKKYGDMLDNVSKITEKVINETTKKNCDFETTLNTFFKKNNIR